MTRHLHCPIWIEWSTIQTQSSAISLRRSRAASPIRSSHIRPVDPAGVISSWPVAEPSNSKTLAAHRNDAPRSRTSDTNHSTTHTEYC